MEPKKYDKGIKWLHNFLYNTEISKEKFSISLLKIINEVSCYRRDGNHMLKDILRSITYKNSKFALKGTNKRLFKCLRLFK